MLLVLCPTFLAYLRSLIMDAYEVRSRYKSE